MTVYGVGVCINCDPVRQEQVGPELAVEYGRCPECDASLFGLLGTEADDLRDFVITKVSYCPRSDELVFATPWGERAVKRMDVVEFRDIPPEQMLRVYASATGIHLDEADIDISSAGLLSDLFHDLADDLRDALETRG